MSEDPYASLGLTKTATDAEIKKAYRKIARDSHPDLNPDDDKAEARFKAASAAYDFLKDTEQRARFDRGEIDASGAEKQPQRQYYREYADAPGNPYRGGRQYGGFESGVDPADIFAEFARQRGQAGRGAQDFSAPGPDRHYSLEVSFLDAVKGGKTRITLPDGGSIEVSIPVGTADGQVIRLRGKGGAGYGGGLAGNALVTLTVRSHLVFRREDDDIVVVLPVAIDEAVLGGKVEVPTIDGVVKLSIPKGASSGQILRMRGRGVKAVGGKARGDQRVELKIVMPAEIDDDLADFFEEWRKDHAYDPRKGAKT
ncbi:MAG: DnaJ C-terminal domain-containing protein [Paracoccaceae bacterium]